MSDPIDNKFEAICEMITEQGFEDEVVRVYASKRVYEYSNADDEYDTGEKYVQIEFLERGVTVLEDELEVPFSEEFLSQVERLATGDWEYLATEGEPGAITISNTETPVYYEDDGYTRKKEF